MIASPVGPASPLVVCGRYQVVRALGTGAQSTVFLVRDLALCRWRALKVAASLEGRQRFLREARVMTRLAQANVVKVFDVIDLAGRPALLMELAGGGSVSRWMRTWGPLPAAWAVGVAIECAEALAHAHEAGVLHRDVKPGNVLIHDDGRVVLADFGIARWDDDQISLTAEGGLVGTMTYMSPEQRAGERLDARADIYGLGATLFTCCTGRREPELCLADRKPQLLEGLPPSVAEVVRRCCRWRRDDRPPSMRAVLALLREAQAGCPPVPADVPALGARAMPLEHEVQTTCDPYVAQLRRWVVPPLEDLPTRIDTPPEADGPPAWALASIAPTLEPAESTCGTETAALTERWRDAVAATALALGIVSTIAAVVGVAAYLEHAI